MYRQGSNESKGTRFPRRGVCILVNKLCSLFRVQPVVLQAPTNKQSSLIKVDLFGGTHHTKPPFVGRRREFRPTWCRLSVTVSVGSPLCPYAGQRDGGWGLRVEGLVIRIKGCGLKVEDLMFGRNLLHARTIQAIVKHLCSKFCRASNTFVERTSAFARGSTRRATCRVEG